MGRIGQLFNAAFTAIGAVGRPFIGRPVTLGDALLSRYPELRQARWRRGGLPARIGGWCLGQRSVAAITLWRTVWLANDLEPTVDLALHELRHVHQFEASRLFPILYVWESLRHGYYANRFEADARQYALTRVRERVMDV